MQLSAKFKNILKGIQSHLKFSKIAPQPLLSEENPLIDMSAGAGLRKGRHAHHSSRELKHACF